MARKPEPKAGPPIVVKQSLPTPAPVAASAEAALESPAAIPEMAVPTVKPGVSPPISDESSKPAAVSQLSPGALIYKVNPQYPATARNARVQGSVVMRAVIGTDGSIQQLELIKGNPLLVNAAMDAAKKWRYRPTLLDGKPVEVETTITISFKGE
jgi:protein TonB